MLAVLIIPELAQGAASISHLSSTLPRHLSAYKIAVFFRVFGR